MAGAAAQGAAAGSAFGPWGAAIGGAMGLASDAMNTPSGPAISSTGPQTTGYDSVLRQSFGENWNVNFGSGDIKSSADSGDGIKMPKVPSWLWIAGAIGGLIWLKKRKYR
ncbi:MAG TPA: hypothetical protein VFF03_15005 [Rhodocyclaceae bacterium]|nr:hypothetical protein [Rhodocyclaceae bacterium]